MNKIMMILAMLGLIILALNTDAQDSLFVPAGDYPVGGRANSVFAADLDDDGYFDLAAAVGEAHEPNHHASILLNNGDGTFAAAVNYEAGDSPYSIFSANFDGDNVNDLVVTNYLSDTICILLNNGDGIFAAPVNYETGNAPWSVFAVDLDGDSDKDLAVANGDSNDVSILLNNGDGIFAAPVNYDAGDNSKSVFSADLDGDSDNDLAVANYNSDNVSILLNNGDGTFAATVNYGAGDRPHSVFSADFDGDNDNDLAVANWWYFHVSILMNNGDGTFAAPVSYGTGHYHPSVFSADFDGDNDNDLAVANYSSNNVSIWLNNGEGTFTETLSYATGTSPHSVFSTDLDSDGDYDLAVANQGSNNISVLMNLTNTPHTGPVWYVSTGGNDSTGNGSESNPFATIQHAINVSTNGDTVLIADGTYMGDGNRDIDYGGKSIVVTSVNGSEATIIDCQSDSLNLRRGFYFHSGEDSNSVLEGITIQNGVSGNGLPGAGGVFCENASPSLIGCVFRDNRGHYGGAVACHHSGATLVDCQFLSNTTSGYAGGLYSKHFGGDTVRPKIVGCVFGANQLAAYFSESWSGGWYQDPTPVTLVGCIFTENYEYGDYSALEFHTVNAIVRNCTFARNSTPNTGFVIGSYADTAAFENCIVAFNGDGKPIFVSMNDDDDSLAISCCDIYGNTGGDWVDSLAAYAGLNGNISLDALFCDTANGDYSISSASPCAPENNSCSLLIGSEDVGCGPPDSVGLVGYWSFDEGSGDTAYDCSANGNHGSIHGATWVNGKIGYALDFDGSNDYVNILDDESQQITTNEITVAAWIKLEGDVGNAQRRIINKQQSGNIAWGLEFFGNGYQGSTGNQIHFHDSDGSTAWYKCLSPTHLNLYEWYHVAASDSSGVIKVYLNGELDWSCAEGYGLPQSINAPIVIGSYAGIDLFFDGVIDEVRMYDRALNGNEIQAIYDSSFKNVLVYITEDGTGYGYDISFFNDGLPAILSDHSYSVTIVDRIIMTEITDSILAYYDQLWILSTNPYSTGCFTSEEITAILDFRETGDGLLIMADHQDPTYNYQADANQISTTLGVTYYGNADHGPHGSEITPVFSQHPLFEGVNTIVGSASEGIINAADSASITATYQGDNLIAVLDDGNGRVVFDVSFTRLWDDGVMGLSWISTGNTPQYVRNIADWLMAESPTETFPILSLSSDSIFGDSIGFYPLTGDSVTLFEFRINYLDSAGNWPQSGYPRLALDWDGNGAIDNENDGYFPMMQTVADSMVIDGVDYSVFAAIPSGGNPKIKFEATNSIDQTATYPESGWLDGPYVVDANSTDLLLYADDITYSGFPDHPQVGEEFSVYARLHNNSPFQYNNVSVYMYFDEDIVDSFEVNLPPRDVSGTWGFVEVSFDTVINNVDFIDVKITIDVHDEVEEWNELNNSAIRALFIGDYNLAGYIALNPNSLGSYYPLTMVSSGGYAWYEEDGNFLRYLSGTPIYFRILEIGFDEDTVHVNDNGYFGYSFRTPMDTGLYHIEMTVTDFTLTRTDTIPFQVVPYPLPGPNLVIGYELSGFPLNTCGRDLSINNPVVYNTGDGPSGPCKAAIIHQGSTILDVNIPSLDPGQFFIMSQTGLTVSYSTPGNYYVKGLVDYDNEVEETREWDNTKYNTFTVWCCPADLNPTDLNFGGVLYKNRPVSISAKVYNAGSVSIDDFDLMFIDSYWGGADTIAVLENLSLSAYGTYNWFSISSHLFPDTGLHTITVVSDPDGMVEECSESNNSYSENIYIKLPVLDVYTSYEKITVDNPNAGEGDVVHFRAEVVCGPDSTAYGFNVYFGLNGGGYTANPMVYVDSIPKSTSAIIEHPAAWTIDFSKCPLDVYVDSGNLLSEFNEGNNCDTVPMPYDFYPVYGYRCPQYPYSPPYFFDKCGPVFTNEEVTIRLTGRNSGIFSFNDSLLIHVYDSLAGSGSKELIESRDIVGPFLNHNANLVRDSLIHSFTQPGIHYITAKWNPALEIAECDYSNNAVTYSMEVLAPLPDLVVQSEYIVPSELNPELGDTICIENADIYNEGDSTAYGVEVLCFIDSDTLGGIVIIDSIPFDEPFNYRPYQPTECIAVDTCEPSTRIFEICADPFNYINENIEDNNCATKSVIFCEAPELYFTAINFNPICAEPGQFIEIEAFVADTGEADASAIIKFYYLDNPENNEWVDTVFIASAGLDYVSAGNTVGEPVSVSWELTAMDSTYIYVEISYSYPHDYYQENNIFTALYWPYDPGDADGNRVINLLDITYLINYLYKTGPPPIPYGILSGDPNCNCVVNLLDITHLISFLYKGGPEPYCCGCWIQNCGNPQ